MSDLVDVRGIVGVWLFTDLAEGGGGANYFEILR